MAMEIFYHFLQKMGYDHPVHPPITHIPIGLIVAVFFTSSAHSPAEP
jgi:uncharacterized membrane protein